MQTRVRGPTSPALTPISARNSFLQRCRAHACQPGKCDDDRKKRSLLQRRPFSGTEPTTVPPIVTEVLRAPGQPLDPGARALMEPRFGHDFSRVRVHTDARAAESARAVNALAYTVGRDVVFGAGAYAPRTTEGRRLLAHELTHVVQQGGSVQGTPGSLSRPGDRWEREAETVTTARNAESVARDKAITALQNAGQAVLMRTPLFTSTMSICRRLLQSRVFPMSEPGLIVRANAAWEPSSEWQGTSMPECGRSSYNVTLMQQGLIFDSEYGTCEFEQGKWHSRAWTAVPRGDYYLTIWTNNTNPNCCLRGDIEVSQESGLRGRSCTRAPPGPLEVVHTALDAAGLIPGLGVIPDAVNAGIYLIEGDWAGAGLSAVAIVPIFGDAASIVRIGRRSAVRVTGDAIERVGSDAIARGLREASTREVDEAIERAFIERRVSSGELIHLLGYRTARRARKARGVSGRQVEAAHGAPRSTMRGVSSYDPDAALARLLPRATHRAMDRFWQREARRLVRQGRSDWTAQEMFEAVSESIRRTPGLSDAEKFSHIQRLSDEIFVEFGLSSSDVLRLPFAR